MQRSKSSLHLHQELLRLRDKFPLVTKIPSALIIHSYMCVCVCVFIGSNSHCSRPVSGTYGMICAINHGSHCSALQWDVCDVNEDLKLPLYL